MVPLAVEGGTAPSLTPWETSEARSLVSRPPINPAADGSYSLTLPSRSVTTFVADSFNRPPQGISLAGGVVRENLPVGTLVGTLSATDADPGESFGYVLVAGEGDDDNGAFTLVGAQLRATVSFDYEAKPTRSIRVRVYDSRGATFERALTITIQDDEADYGNWAAALPADRRGPAMDADGDGLANLLAYAFGAAPGQRPPAGRGLKFVRVDGVMFVEIVLPGPAAEDLVFRVERSVDLAVWEELATKRGASAWEGPVTPVAGDEGENVVLVPVDTSSGRMFFRLRAGFLNSE